MDTYNASTSSKSSRARLQIRQEEDPCIACGAVARELLEVSRMNQLTDRFLDTEAPACDAVQVNSVLR